MKSDTGSDGPGLNGAIMQRQNAQQPWMNYVDVASIDDALEKAVATGEKVALPPRSSPQKATFAGFRKPPRNKTYRSLTVAARNEAYCR